MEQRLKIFTHETVVHSQIGTIERILNRQIDFAITINLQKERSNIQFDATQQELEELNKDLTNKIFVRDGNHWIPYL